MKEAAIQFWITITFLVCGLSFDGNLAASQEKNLPSAGSSPAANPSVVDDPSLPRYLFIGDSISSNYSKAIRDLHAGKLNVHQPPTNCRSSSNGREKLSVWLGDFRQKGRQWDVISFNFGHWDAESSRQEYQENLHDIVRQLKKTDAQLVWVTTCPVPAGCEPVTEQASHDHAPGRKSEVMKKFLNPWAAEVMADYPEITVCDQWRFVHENRNGVYKAWWDGDDIHFSGAPAYGIGRLLARHVLELVGSYRGPGWKKRTIGDRTTRPNRNGAAWRPEPYAGSKTETYYSETETADHLPKRWKNARRLPDGFPRGLPISLSPEIPDHQGWTYNLVEIANHLQLKSIKTDIQNGHRLAWYFLPDEDRYRVGPGLNGDQLLADLNSRKVPEHMAQDHFVKDVINNNVSTLYDMYRITRDRYYSAQIVKYAEAVDLLLKFRPELLLPPSAKNQLPRENNSTSSRAFLEATSLWAHVNASRLLLEQVRVDRGGPTDARVDTARRLLNTANEKLASLLDAGYQSPLQLDAQAHERTPFVPGENTLWLVQKRRVPERMAQMIEYMPWNQTLVYLSVLTAATRAMEELQGLENTDDYQELIGSYRRTIAAGIELLQRENDCVVLDGVPYFFHAHDPRKDRESETRMGHPLFRGEDTASVSAIVWQLAYIWDSGESFGCPTALVAGYTNAMIDLLDHPTGEKNGKLYPRGHLDSPWYIAATGQLGSSAARLGENFIATAPFAAAIYKAHRYWNPRKEKNEDLQLLRAATLYRQWQRRKERIGN